MTDDGQAQNSCSNLAGQRGMGETGVLVPPSISKIIGFAMSKLCRTRPQPGMCF